MPAPRMACWTAFVLLILAGVGARVASVGYNAWPHGDVLLDAAVADSLLRSGELKVPLVDVRAYPIGRFAFGYPPDQHPPLWPLLGAAVGLLWRDSYEALKLVSLGAGLLLLAVVYRCGRDLLGRGPARLATALCACSYLLIDFSGNGSLWGLLALLYLLFVWRLACFPLADRRNGVLLGLLMGTAYLTNYPAVVLPLVYLAALCHWRLRGRPPDDGPENEVGQPAPVKAPGPVDQLLPLLVAGLVVAPWLVFNLATFGNPVWSQPLERQLGGGDTRVEVVLRDDEVVKRYLPSGDPLAGRARATLQNLYGNVGFLVRQSFVLLPFLGGFALAAVALLSLRALRGRIGSGLPLLLLALAHGLLILLWPTTKFRYLVPLFPPLVLLGSWLLWQLEPAHLRRLLAALAVGLAVFTSAWTWASIPSHTYYYDGGVVTDNFGGQGEIAYVAELRQLELAAAAIRQTGPGVVLGPHPLYYLAGEPLVVNSAAFNREIVEHLVQRYAVRYIVAEPSRTSFYSAFLPARVIYQNEQLVVLDVRP